LHGILQSIIGPLDEAVGQLQEAIELLTAIPDYPCLAEARAYLGLCYLRQGKLDQALQMLEQSNRLVATREVRGFQATTPRAGLAEVYLAKAEATEGHTRAVALNSAARACRAALKQGKADSRSVGIASRLQGAYEWFRGRADTARLCWERSMAVAEELGARYDLGQTYLEMGRRTGARTYLERAEQIFGEIGASLDLVEVRRALKRDVT
jgi:tetratricopeptide (TPR) repeat protein